jgi:SHS2 domain-containing protein
MGYRYAEDGPVADLTVESWGATLEEALANAALAMFNAITPLEAVEARVSRAFEVEGDDMGSMLFNFLDELLYINDVDLLVFSEIQLTVDAEAFKLGAVCRGEAFDLARHVQGIAVKAVTFHEMKVEDRDGKWMVRVVLDT